MTARTVLVVTGAVGALGLLGTAAAGAFAPPGETRVGDAVSVGGASTSDVPGEQVSSRRDGWLPWPTTAPGVTPVDAVVVGAVSVVSAASAPDPASSPVAPEPVAPPAGPAPVAPAAPAAPASAASVPSPASAASPASAVSAPSAASGD